MMNFYILTDLEGTSGVVTFEECSSNSPLYKRAKRLATLEVNAAIGGILETGDHKILILDGHGSGGIEFELLHEKAKIILGRPLDMMFYIDSQPFDACIIIGQHAMKNAPKANLDHTFNSKTVISLTLNGQPIGEAGINALMAGLFNIPTIFLSGDKAACKEIRQIIPNIHTCEVKEGLTTSSAICLSPKAAQNKIRTSVANAIRNMDDIKPYIIDPPYEAEWVFSNPSSILPYIDKDYCEVIDQNRVKIYSDCLDDLLRSKLWGHKI